VDGPLIGITADLDSGRHQVGEGYSAAVRDAGGVPVVLPCEPRCAAAYVALCDGLVLSGGGDPATEPWGEPTHPRARALDPRRQEFEVALLEAIDAEGGIPVLGICLGMQLMGLHRGGRLDQYLPETLATAERHSPGRSHAVSGAFGSGPVHSNHRQALADPGSLHVVARSEDGVIEAVRDERRPFYVGVQWHPERTADDALGPGLFRDLIAAARTRQRDRSQVQAT
jgi:putative glutamine amidotransferase